MKAKDRQLFLAIGAAFMVTLYFVALPLANWWSARQTQIKQLRDQVKEGNGLLRRAEVIRGHWASMCTNALPTVKSDAEQQLLKTMDGWSRDSGADITSIMPQWKVESTNYLTLNCRVETSGDLGALTKFIYAIEQGPLAVRLDTVELSARDNTGQQMTLGVEINGLALYQNNKK